MRAPSPSDADDAAPAAEALRERLEGRRPRVALTLGSGLDGLVAHIEDPLGIPCGELPGWPVPAVSGHAGRIVAGRLDGVEVLGLQGRVHLYEGGSPARTTFYVRALARLGVSALFVTNAAGAIDPAFPAGSLMLIRDHIDLTFRSPLAGPLRGPEERFPDMSGPYDPRLQEALRSAAREERLRLYEGVYAAVLGPSYETPAEIRALARLGAQAVGMSTVPEVLVARAWGLRCVGVSCLTNPAAGTTPEPLDHAEVLSTAARVAGDFERLVVRSLRGLAAGRE